MFSVLSQPVNLGAKFKGPLSAEEIRRHLWLCFSVLGCRRPPHSVFCSLSKCSSNPSSLLRSLTFQGKTPRFVFAPLAFQGPHAPVRCLLPSGRFCSVGRLLTSRTSPGLPRKILYCSHQVLWIPHPDLPNFVTFKICNQWRYKCGSPKSCLRCSVYPATVFGICFCIFTIGRIAVSSF